MVRNLPSRRGHARCTSIRRVHLQASIAGAGAVVPSTDRAFLLARVFQVHAEKCPRCAGKMKIVAALTDPASIRQYRAIRAVAVLAIEAENRVAEEQSLLCVSKHAVFLASSPEPFETRASAFLRDSAIVPPHPSFPWGTIYFETSETHSL